MKRHSDERQSLKEAEYWSSFYASKKTVNEPSDFAKFIDDRYPDRRASVEFGCGNGRDSIYFAQSGRRVFGLDLCQEAIEQCKELAKEKDVAGFCEFRAMDIIDTHEVHSQLRLHRDTEVPTIFYARFFLHSIDGDRESSLFKIIGANLQAEDVLCLEFRTTQDSKTPKLFGNHYRRFLNVDEVIEQCRAHHLTIEYSVEGDGMAVFGSENPHVARILARRERNA